MRLIDADMIRDKLKQKEINPATIFINEVLIGLLDDAPTVDAVEVVHGEWNQIEIIDDDSENGVNDDASQCSVCGDVFDSYYWAKTYFNYCPNCGARMGGGRDEC